MSLNDLIIFTDEKTFNRRGELDVCHEDKHEWKIIVMCNDYNPKPGIAICTKCALLEGGWVNNRIIND